MKRSILFLFLATILTTVSAQEKLRLTLDDAIATALENNYGQKILEVSRQSASEEVAQSKRDLFPDFNASLSQSVSDQDHNGSYGINTSVTLWKGGQGINAVRRSKVALNQSDSQIAQAQNKLMINIIQSYMTVLMNNELYNYQTEVAHISEEQMKQGESKFRSEEILESDYLLLKAQFENDSYSVTNNRINRDNAIVELKTLLCVDSQTQIETVVPSSFTLKTLSMPTLDELISETRAWLPDLKIVNQNIELAQIDTKIAKGALLPTISLGGSIGTGYNNLNTGNWGKQFTGNYSQQLSLTLSIPIWNKGKTQSNIKQSKYRLTQAQLEAQQTELNLRNSLEKEYQNVISLREKYFAAQSGSNAYEESFKVFSTQFEAGSISTTELLQQKNNYLSALNNFIQSKYNFLMSRKVLDVYMGNNINI